MTDAQKRFCDEYLVDLNATRAYKVAYPKVKKDETANTNASRMLRNAKVKTYIDQELGEMHSSKVADVQEVMEYLTKVMRGETESEIVVVEGIGDGCSEARRMKKAPDEKEKMKAAELLGKRYGAFVEKKEISGNIESSSNKLLESINRQLSGANGRK